MEISELLYIPRCLFFLGQISKRGSGFHEFSPKGYCVELHKGVKQCFIAGEIAIKGPGGYTSVLYNLTQSPESPCPRIPA